MDPRAGAEHRMTRRNRKRGVALDRDRSLGGDLVALRRREIDRHPSPAQTTSRVPFFNFGHDPGSAARRTQRHALSVSVAGSYMGIVTLPETSSGGPSVFSPIKVSAAMIPVAGSLSRSPFPLSLHIFTLAMSTSSPFNGAGWVRLNLNLNHLTLYPSHCMTIFKKPLLITPWVYCVPTSSPA